MVRTVRAWGLLALGLVVSAVPSFSQDLGGAFEAAKAAAQASALEAAGKSVPQSGKDLYYFTKESAAAAKKKFAFRTQAVNNKDLVFDSDVPADIQAQMRADMAFMGTIKGSGATPLHKKIFGAVDGAAYLKFFNTRVSGIGMDDCGSAKAVACVIPFQDPSKMWLTQNFIKFDHPQISRMMIVFHEARHTESRNGNWGHATCPTPFLDANGKDMVSIWTGATLAGEPACDVTPLGSYGSSTILLKNVQKYCANCTDKVKMDAGLYADDQLGRITDDGAKREMLSDFDK
jgi:hypothetical protein